MKLRDKVAVVTGGSRGIGRGISIGLAQEGAAVVVNYTRNAGAAQAVVAEIARGGGTATAMMADVTECAEVEKLFDNVVGQFGRLDLLINNAGIAKDRLVVRMSEQDWDEVVDTNLKGPFLCSKAAIGIFLKHKTPGVIVNIGSIVGRIGGAGQANYSASKAGLFGLTKSLARELGSRNIRVNAVAPGFIETDMTSSLKPEYRESILKQIPLGRFGAAEDVGQLVAFLCSADAAYIHGQVISVDGGLAM